MSTPIFVTIEGLSCTGKSTVCGMLANTLDASTMPTVPDEYALLRKRLASRDLLDARFLLFMSAVVMASTAIQKELASGRHVVAESYIARTIAFHRGMGSSVEIRIPDLLQPDVSFYLICDESVRADRARRRGGVRHYWDRLAEAHTSEIVQKYGKFTHHVVDTTTLTPEAVVRQMAIHPLDGSCSCENGQRLAGYPDLLSTLSQQAIRD